MLFLVVADLLRRRNAEVEIRLFCSPWTDERTNAVSFEDLLRCAVRVSRMLPILVYFLLRPLCGLFGVACGI